MADSLTEKRRQEKIGRIMSASLRFLGVFAALMLLGAGCFGNTPSPSAEVAGLNGNPVEAAQAIQFIPGDTFEIKQNSKGSNKITLQRFVPFNTAELAWSRMTDNVVTTGTVTNIGLNNTHAAYFPAYWTATVQSLANEKSGIWLSDDAYQELSRTRYTILNYGVLDAESNQLAKDIPDFKQALDELRGRADVDGKNHDLTLMKADPEPIEWKISVNGKERTVSAIRARNWFGEIIVLNNRQNPMVLKLALNQDEFMDKIYGYEIANIELKR